MKAKKHLGQNFLNSEGAIDKIALVSDISKGDFVLESGPGKGKLTEKLLRQKAKVLAIEKDPELIPLLEEKFAKEIKSGQLTLKNEDILDFETNTLPKKYKLIANIPYYITGKIFRIFTSINNLPTKIVMIVQKEVAERIVAKDNKESILSVIIKTIGKPKYIQTVGKGSFWPVPKVDSSIICIDDISDKNLGNLDKELFFKILKTGFGQKRKTIFNNLKNFDKKISAGDLEKILDKINLKKEIRAEDIAVEKWLGLAKCFSKN